MPVTAILLAAGYATRLYPLTKDRPKALLPLGSGVILDAVLQSMADATDIVRRVLVTNHRFAEQFRTWQAATHAPVEIIDDGTDTAQTRLGAIRDLELARTRGGAVGDLLVLGTDNLFGWPMRRFLDPAQARRPDPSIGIWELPEGADSSQFGIVTCDRGTTKISAFVEKSKTPPSRQVALCLYYFPEPMLGEIGRFLAEGGNPDAPGYFLEWLVRQRAVHAVPLRGAWYDIGALGAYQDVLTAWPPRTK